MVPLRAGDISFDPTITQQQFRDFSEVVGQAIYATPVDAPQSGGALQFDVGVAVNAVPVDENAAYWTRSVSGDFTQGGYLLVPRVTASKGFLFATIGATYAKVPRSDVSVLGGSIDVPIIRGNLVKPTLAVRGTYSQVQGVHALDLNTYGAELMLSKGFGPVTPYGSIGMARTSSTGHIESTINGEPQSFTMHESFDHERYTVGVRISMLIPKIVIEATQGQKRTYAAKVSLGF